MFRTRIPSLSSIFCLRTRRPKEKTSSPVLYSPKSSRPVSPLPEPNDASFTSTIRSRHPSTHTRISDTSLPAPTDILIIGPEQDTTQIASPPSPEPILPGDIGSQIAPDDLSHLESQRINPPYVSLQVPPTRTDGSPSPPELVARTVVVVETGRPVPPEITITSPSPGAESDPDCDSATGHTPRSSLAFAGTELGVSAPRLDRAHHRSLFVPQPVRAESVRLSVPTTSRVKIKSEHARESIRQSERTSLLPIGRAAGTAWREKKSPRHRRETSKQETQDELRTFQGKKSDDVLCDK